MKYPPTSASTPANSYPSCCAFESVCLRARRRRVVCCMVVALPLHLSVSAACVDQRQASSCSSSFSRTHCFILPASDLPPCFDPFLTYDISNCHICMLVTENYHWSFKAVCQATPREILTGYHLLYLHSLLNTQILAKPLICAFG